MKSELTGIDWDNLEPGTLLEVVSHQTFALHKKNNNPYLNPDINPPEYWMRLHRGDVAIFLGYDRKRNWMGEVGLRQVRMLAQGRVGWCDIRAMDGAFRTLTSNR